MKLTLPSLIIIILFTHSQAQRQQDNANAAASGEHEAQKILQLQTQLAAASAKKLELSTSVASVTAELSQVQCAHADTVKALRQQVSTLNADTGRLGRELQETQIILEAERSKLVELTRANTVAQQRHEAVVQTTKEKVSIYPQSHHRFLCHSERLVFGCSGDFIRFHGLLGKFWFCISHVYRCACVRDTTKILTAQCSQIKCCGGSPRCSGRTRETQSHRRNGVASQGAGGSHSEGYGRKAKAAT